MPSLPTNQFKYLRPITWSEVFDIWRHDEEKRPEWVELYKERGCKNWHQWRERNTIPLKCASRQWFIYQVIDPLISVPQFKVGPHLSWIEKYWPNQPTPTFAEIITMGDMPQRINQPTDKIYQLARNFPATSTVIGLKHDDSIVIIEGTHRCVTLAHATALNKPITTSLFIALADATGEELPILSTLKNRKSKQLITSS